jgi:hypothetical protein
MIIRFSRGNPDAYPKISQYRAEKQAVNEKCKKGLNGYRVNN